MSPEVRELLKELEEERLERDARERFLREQDAARYDPDDPCDKAF